ncbi:large conductance mechanosensitive channel protein MscL [Sanguibacter antarcticus]|uniref:Large-conductance mechanosensitive channel n=1 Tax=Sanguibacter antarcticus TaxID=372484 RepID=A0A2A9E264_9MICO|nr:large conductance mechanosensitive channel protein MscL [Sanguibacter antarcticus]PFG32302.1 large conductance mechanosensitive channel [Sanguibacter antarcticus]
MKNVIIGFKEFIMRGNVIDLAVGIVIGSAFATVVTSLVEGLLTPLIAAVFGARDLSNAMSFEINHALFSFGLVLNAVIHFLFVAAALYFFVVVPINHLQSLRKRGLVEEPEAPAEEVLLLQQIRDLLQAQKSVGGSHPTAGPSTPPAPPAPPVGY